MKLLGARLEELGAAAEALHMGKVTTAIEQAATTLRGCSASQ